MFASSAHHRLPSYTHSLTHTLQVTDEPLLRRAEQQNNLGYSRSSQRLFFPHLKHWRTFSRRTATTFQKGTPILSPRSALRKANQDTQNSTGLTFTYCALRSSSGILTPCANGLMCVIKGGMHLLPIWYDSLGHVPALLGWKPYQFHINFSDFINNILLNKTANHLYTLHIYKDVLTRTQDIQELFSVQRTDAKNP